MSKNKDAENFNYIIENFINGNRKHSLDGYKKLKGLKRLQFVLFLNENYQDYLTELFEYYSKNYNNKHWY